MKRSYTPALDNLEGRCLLSTNLLQNGSFEAVQVGFPGQAYDYQYCPTYGSNWTFRGISGVSGNGTDFTSGNDPAPTGGQVAFLYGTASIAQTFTSPTDGTAKISFRAEQSATVGQQQQTLNVLVNGVPVGQVTPPKMDENYYNYWADYSFNLIDAPIVAGENTIELDGLATDQSTILVDDVQVIPPAKTTLSMSDMSFSGQTTPVSQTFTVTADGFYGLSFSQAFPDGPGSYGSGVTVSIDKTGDSYPNDVFRVMTEYKTGTPVGYSPAQLLDVNTANPTSNSVVLYAGQSYTINFYGLGDVSIKDVQLTSAS